MGLVHLHTLTMTAPAALADEFSRARSTSTMSVASTSETTPADNTTLSHNDRPDIPSPAYERMRPRWEKCRTLMGGTDAIRAGAETYLPRLEGESTDAYAFRSQLVALFNGFARTVKACVGLINQKEPTLGSDMPAPLTAMAENVDRAGTHLAVFTKQLTTDGMIDGFGGILTDYPRVANPGGVDSDAEKRAGLRPYFVRYRADDVIKAIYQTIDGVRTLVLLVLRETSDEPVGAFGIETVLRYRVYRQKGAVVEYELWERAARESTPKPASTPAPMQNVTRIPWSPLITGDVVDANETRPPLNDLADLNIEHYQVKTNIRNLETLAMVPMIVRIGAEPDRETGEYPRVAIGPRGTLEVPATDGVATPIYWLSPDVTVLDPGNKSLEKIEAQMGAAGLAFLAPDTRAAETAEAKRIDSTAQNSNLRNVSRAVQDCLESAFGFAAQFIKAKGGSVTMNADFENVVMDPAMVAELRALSIAGKLSLETLLQLLEKGKVLEEGFDIDAEVKRILTENAALVPPPPIDNGPGTTPPAP